MLLLILFGLTIIYSSISLYLYYRDITIFKYLKGLTRKEKNILKFLINNILKEQCRDIEFLKNKFGLTDEEFGKFIDKLKKFELVSEDFEMNSYKNICISTRKLISLYI